MKKFSSGIITLKGFKEDELLNPDSAGGPSVGEVVFKAQPSMRESGNAIYNEIATNIRAAASLLIYQGSPARTFSIDGVFISRTKAEGEENLRYVKLLKSWRLPEKEGTGFQGVEAPARLRLSGLNQLYNIPVRMIDLSISYNNDIDYIKLDSGVNVPIVWEVSITLKESRSIRDLEQFNIEKFRNGTLNYDW